MEKRAAFSTAERRPAAAEGLAEVADGVDPGATDVEVPYDGEAVGVGSPHPGREPGVGGARGRVQGDDALGGGAVGLRELAADQDRAGGQDVEGVGGAVEPRPPARLPLAGLGVERGQERLVDAGPGATGVDDLGELARGVDGRADDLEVPDLGPADLRGVGVHPPLDPVRAHDRSDRRPLGRGGVIDLGGRRGRRGPADDGDQAGQGDQDGEGAEATHDQRALSPRSKARSLLPSAWWTSTAITLSPLRRAPAGIVKSVKRVWAAPVTNAVAVVDDVIVPPGRLSRTSSVPFR